MALKILWTLQAEKGYDDIIIAGKLKRQHKNIIILYFSLLILQILTLPLNDVNK